MNNVASNIFRIGGHDPKIIKKIINNTILLKESNSIQKIASAMSDSAVLYQSHLTRSPLSSASLLASFLRHKIIRYNEVPTRLYIRKLLALMDSKNSIWNVTDDQTQKIALLNARLKELKTQRGFLEIKRKFENDSNLLLKPFLKRNESAQLSVDNQIEALDADIAALDSILANSLTNASFSIHPNALKSPVKMRGMAIRIAGPNKGSRAEVHKDLVGSTCHNSDLIIAEEAKTQLPSKIGAFGLTVLLVWSRSSDLASTGLAIKDHTGKIIAPFNVIPRADNVVPVVK